MSTENVSSEDQPEVSDSLEAGSGDVAPVEGSLDAGDQVDAGSPVEDAVEEELNEFGFSAAEMVTDDDLVLSLIHI